MIPYRAVPSIELGPVAVRTFGLAVAVGVLVATRILVREARRHSLASGAIEGLALSIVVVGLAGSRMAYVVSHPSRFASRPLAVLAVWEGGLQFFGGFAVAAVFLWAWLRRHPELPRRTLADGLALALVAGMALGRIGCYAVGEHLGGDTAFPLGVRYRGGDTVEGPLEVGATVHSTALYEILGLTALFWVLHRLRARGVPPGTVAVVAALWYGAQRFTTDFLRAYDRRVWVLTAAQLACVGLVAAGAVAANRLRRRPGERYLEVATG